MVAGRCCAPHAARVRSSRNAGEKVATATVIAVEIVRKSPDQVGFAVQPRRWVVERFFAAATLLTTSPGYSLEYLLSRHHGPACRR